MVWSISLLLFVTSVASFNLLGGNVGGIGDYSMEPVFVNGLKGARSIGRAGDPWNGDPNMTFDSNGWPLKDWGTVFLTADSIGYQPELYGDWSVQWKGPGNMRLIATSGVNLHNFTYNNVTDTTTGFMNVTAGFVQYHQIMLSFTETEGRVKDVKIIRPGYPVDTKQVFTNWYLNSRKGINTFRFMDWLVTNTNFKKTWADSAPADAATFTWRGASYEVCAQLCNALGANAWITIPDKVDDDYVHQVAKVMKATLNPKLILYVEYSNEVWNPDFNQFYYNMDQAQAQLKSNDTFNKIVGNDSDRYALAFKRVALRIYEISNIFRSVYGNDKMITYVRPVLAQQFVNPFTYTVGLHMLNKNFGAPSKYLFGIAGAPYFSPGIEDRANLTVQEIIDGLKADSQKLMGAKNNLHYDNLLWTTWFGIDYLAYEGGPDTARRDLTVAKNHLAQNDTQMRSILVDFFKAWYMKGYKLYCHYSIGAGPWSGFGDWSLSNDAANLTYASKARAFNDALTTFTESQFSISDAAPSIEQNVSITWRYFGIGGERYYMISVPEKFGGNYTLTFNVENKGTNTSMQIFVNGVYSQTMVFANKTNGNFSTPHSVQLNPSLNTIRLYCENTTANKEVPVGQPYFVMNQFAKLTAKFTSYPPTYNPRPYTYQDAPPSASTGTTTGSVSTTSDKDQMSSSSALSVVVGLSMLLFAFV